MPPENTKTLVVSSNLGIPDQTVVATPAGMPNVVLKAVSPLLIAFKRILRIYVTSFAAMYTLVLSPVAPDTLIRPGDLWGNILLAGSLALAPAFGVLVTNTVELAVRWDTPSKP